MPQSDQSESPTRRQMLEALLIREDLLSSRDWPWTTDQLREAYAKLEPALDETNNKKD